MSKSNRKAVARIPGQPAEETTMGTGLDLDAVGGEPAQTDPGEPFDPEAPAADPNAEQSDVDAAIEAAQSGNARPIVKPRAPVAPAVVSRPDTQRPSNAAVNQAPTMSYADAMQAIKDGTLERSVLTERGWVAAPLRVPAETKR